MSTKTKTEYLSMYAVLKMDREIDYHKHYISPGGYELLFANGAKVAFDFNMYIGTIDEDDKTILRCEQRELDTDSFEGADQLLSLLLESTVTRILEFYVYIGEDNETEIHPVTIENLTFETSDGTISISVHPEILNQYKFE